MPVRTLTLHHAYLYPSFYTVAQKYANDIFCIEISDTCILCWKSLQLGVVFVERIHNVFIHYNMNRFFFLCVTLKNLLGAYSYHPLLYYVHNGRSRFNSVILELSECHTKSEQLVNTVKNQHCPFCALRCMSTIVVLNGFHFAFPLWI